MQVTPTHSASQRHEGTVPRPRQRIQMRAKSPIAVRPGQPYFRFVPHLRLTDLSGKPVGESHGEILRFGREPGLAVLVSGDAAKVVSARHAELRVEDGIWVIADLGSRNGTYLNGT